MKVAQSGKKWNFFSRKGDADARLYAEIPDPDSLTELGMPADPERIIGLDNADPTLPDELNLDVIPGPGMNHLANVSESGPTPLIPRRPKADQPSILDLTPELGAKTPVPEQLKNLDLSQVDISDAPGPGEEHLALAAFSRTSTRQTDAQTAPQDAQNPIETKSRKRTNRKKGRKQVKNGGMINHTENVSGVDIPVLRPVLTR